MSQNSLDLSNVATVAPVREDLPRRELLTPLPEAGHYLLVIDNSSNDKVKRCHVAGANYLFYGREGHATTAALGFGGAVHKGLELMLRGADDLAIAKAVIQYFTDNPQPPDEYRTPQTAIEVLIHYRERAKLPDYQWDVCSYAGDLLVEKPFELPLGVLELHADIQLPSWESPQRVDFIHVAWSGRMDVVALYENLNRVVDHKTTKIAGDQYIAGFQLASQTIGYVWAGRQLYPEVLLPNERGNYGFCLNAIHLKKPAPGQGLREKGKRGGECPLNFFRANFEYSEERIQQWKENTMVTIEDFVHSLARQFFPMNDKQCFDKFGRCPYYDVCSQDDPQVRSAILNNDAFYKNVTWDPTADR